MQSSRRDPGIFGVAGSKPGDMTGGKDMIRSRRSRKIGKLDIVKILAAAFGYTRYFEITTGMTGGVHAEARRAGFADCRRLVYRLDYCPKADGEPIDFMVPGEDTTATVAEIRGQGFEFDIALVDPHHTYACSIRDLKDTYSLIRPGGALVVHDCDPPNAEIASPEFIEGAWCGVTYRAFLDFVRGNDEIDYFTVDADYGCGVILKRPPRHGPRRLRDAIDRALSRATESELTSQWFAAGRDDKAAFDFFRSNRRRLLRLTKPARFLSKYRRS
ncbi:hypothetical protein [Oricola sp.]|uniref:hypothetical protein n=1 Tax=Oricola sp. TaxID=1979950 RepID=UPI0035173942